ncbi:flagellar protein export ATPase FliI [Roseibium denhamense]|uniref:Flagellum-specific ATP synthase n=1 Tax=Roseibium denhamense TaxID=76305 RepID=A0ABY1PFH6_9HYPH|nr:FliI/YscN family ATPase [Roseibium denhamense]MTI06217.1 flagellar protein export ATPase FliI [Roseibium denhamense]SMP32637.1 flagellum-specific ATP synthase [Roseibium denhamense]
MPHAQHLNALDQISASLAALDTEIGPVKLSGKVTQVSAEAIKVSGLSKLVCLGDLVEFEGRTGIRQGEIIRLDEKDVVIKPLERVTDIGIGNTASVMGGLAIHPDMSWRGRIINALGQPIDGAGQLVHGVEAFLLDRAPPPAMNRSKITDGVKTGVRAIDLFTPLCVGQRVGIFAGSGVGKSTLLGMLAGFGDFDTVVVGLVGERGREVREFIDDILGETLASSVVIASTGDESAMQRRLAPKTAMSVAEYFRAQGHKVLLILDSATRFAHAARDVALAAGEPPVARGYPPSVFADLARLIERAGPGHSDEGSITGIFSVLVDGDDHNDPVSDTIRGLLDGHIVLDRQIADAGRYPPVNVLKSTSRLAGRAWTKEQQELIHRIKGLIAQYEDTKDLRMMGGFQTAGDDMLEKACRLVPKIYEALRQNPDQVLPADPFGELAQALAADR